MLFCGLTFALGPKVRRIIDDGERVYHFCYQKSEPAGGGDKPCRYAFPPNLQGRDIKWQNVALTIINLAFLSS